METQLATDHAIFFGVISTFCPIPLRRGLKTLAGIQEDNHHKWTAFFGRQHSKSSKKLVNAWSSVDEPMRFLEHPDWGWSSTML